MQTCQRKFLKLTKSKDDQVQAEIKEYPDIPNEKKLGNGKPTYSYWDQINLKLSQFIQE